VGNRLSLAMIVKDEGALLAECLDSVRDAVDEVCVLDTGSHDDTVAVARSAGARVAFFPWCDDFAAARNASIEPCTGDWILVLDADERLDRADAARLALLTAAPRDRCYRLMTRNYTDRTSVSAFMRCIPGDPHAQGCAGWFPSWKVRLFPNGVGARYEGTVHELVRPSLERAGLAVAESDIVVHHYPLLHGEARLKAKRRLYIALGIEKLRTDPRDPKAHAELGHQYGELGDWAKAVAAYRSALCLDPRDAESLKNLGGALHLLGRDEEAERALRLAVDYDGGCADAWRNLGVLLADRAQWPAAVECFANAVHLAPEWVDGPRYLAVALEQSGRLEESARAARCAIEACPESAQAVDLYATLMIRLDRRAEALDLLRSLEEEGASVALLGRARDMLQARQA